MKNISALLLFSGLVAAVNVSAGQYGHLISQGSNCVAARVEEAVLRSASGEKSMVLKISVEDDGSAAHYAKRIWLQKSGQGQGSEAMWSSQWWQYALAAQYNYQRYGRTYITLTSQMVGPEDDYSLELYIAMGDFNHACTEIKIGK